jgi:hypothetical protein
VITPYASYEMSLFPTFAFDFGFQSFAVIPRLRRGGKRAAGSRHRLLRGWQLHYFIVRRCYEPAGGSDQTTGSPKQRGSSRIDFLPNSRRNCIAFHPQFARMIGCFGDGSWTALLRLWFGLDLTETTLGRPKNMSKYGIGGSVQASLRTGTSLDGGVGSEDREGSRR